MASMFPRLLLSLCAAFTLTTAAFAQTSKPEQAAAPAEVGEKPFLFESELLKKYGISIGFGEVGRAIEYFDKKETKLAIVNADIGKRVFLELGDQEKPDLNAEYFIIDQLSLRKLVPSTEKFETPRNEIGCATFANFMMFAKSEDTDFIQEDHYLILKGKNIEQHVKWMPATGTQCAKPAHNQCLKDMRQYQDNTLSCLHVKTMDEVFYHTEQRQRFGQVLSNTKEGGHYPPHSQYNFGIQSPKGQCTILNAQDINIHGVENENSYGFNQLLGKLDVDNGAETWLIFKSQGYESSGYAALKYIKGQGAGKMLKTAKHFRGC